MLDGKIEKIDKEDIDTLIENSICENKNLEYKRELHIDLDADKKEFLADISSFANSFGGDILFGIEEDAAEKVPIKIVGIPYENDEPSPSKTRIIFRKVLPVLMAQQLQLFLQSF